MNAEEIEVTEEMISAGMAELSPCTLRPFQDENDVMGRVFVAMVRLWPGMRAE